MIQLKTLLTEMSPSERAEYPPYMYSAQGFGCHVCEYYYKDQEKHMCSNKHYAKLKGTNELVDDRGKQIKDPSKWCSNWFKPKAQ